MSTKPPRRPRLTPEQWAEKRRQRIKELVDAAPPLSGDVLARLQVWATYTRRQMETEGAR